MLIRLRMGMEWLKSRLVSHPSLFYYNFAPSLSQDISLAVYCAYKSPRITQMNPSASPFDGFEIDEAGVDVVTSHLPKRRTQK